MDKIKVMERIGVACLFGLMAYMIFFAGLMIGIGETTKELVKVKLLYNNMSQACNQMIDTANQCFILVGVSQITQKLGYFEEVTP